MEKLKTAGQVLLGLFGLFVLAVLFYAYWDGVIIQLWQFTVLSLYLLAISGGCVVGKLFSDQFDWADRAMSFSIGLSTAALIGLIAQSVEYGVLAVSPSRIIGIVVFSFGISHLVKFSYLSISSQKPVEA